ncbi:MAG: hypothetical protein C0595_07340 [Marinilabiliales bacterium]|nr:MAG: hypothetical protein C0595_07340 [Marinilabiliales bacterium]
MFSNYKIINYISLISSVILLLISSSCNKDNPSPIEGDFQNALFVVNEGNFTTGNSSLTYYNRETEEVIQNVFYRNNNAPLGDVANSIFIDENSIYLTVNNSHTIFKVDKQDASFQGKANQLTSPRFLLKVNDSLAFVSDLYENNITVLNTTNMEIVQKIPLGRTSENMLKFGNEVFITNWSAFNQDKENNMIMVVNSQSMQVIDSIEVGKEPNSIVIDKNNNLWVLCSGGFMNDEHPSLCKINPNTHQLLSKIEFPDITNTPTNLKINPKADSLYFLNTDVYKMSVDALSIPETPIIMQLENINFYCLAISPENEIYVSDANDYNRNGEVHRYSPAGKLISKFDAGIIPGNMTFMD